MKHFFKVGEARAQALTMISSLAYQLAQKLPGMAELLEPVVQQHGGGADLPLEEAFDK